MIKQLYRNSSLAGEKILHSPFMTKHLLTKNFQICHVYYPYLEQPPFIRAIKSLKHKEVVHNINF